MTFYVRTTMAEFIDARCVLTVVCLRRGVGFALELGSDLSSHQSSRTQSSLWGSSNEWADIQVARGRKGGSKFMITIRVVATLQVFWRFARLELWAHTRGVLPFASVGAFHNAPRGT